MNNDDKQLDLLTQVYERQQSMHHDLREHMQDEKEWRSTVEHRMAEHGTRLGHLEADHDVVKKVGKVVKAGVAFFLLLLAFKFGDLGQALKDIWGR